MLRTIITCFLWSVVIFIVLGMLGVHGANSSFSFDLLALTLIVLFIRWVLKKR